MVEFNENKWTPPQKFKSTFDFISNLNFTDFNLSWAAGKTMYFGHCIYPTLIRNINVFRSLFDKVIISSQPLFFLSPSDNPSHCWASRPSICKEIITLWASMIKPKTKKKTKDIFHLSPTLQHYWHDAENYVRNNPSLIKIVMTVILMIDNDYTGKMDGEDDHFCIFASST